MKNLDDLTDDELVAEIQTRLTERNLPHAIYTPAQLSEAIQHHPVWRGTTPAQRDAVVAVITESPEWMESLHDDVLRNVRMYELLSEYGPTGLARADKEE